MKKLTADPHFKSGKPAKFAPAAIPAIPIIYAFVTSAGGLAVIKFTKEALDCVDKVVDIVKKALGNGQVKMEVFCPDGKTKSTIEGSQKQVIEIMTVFLKSCPKAGGKCG
jgi:hypothetical protein